MRKIDELVIVIKDGVVISWVDAFVVAIVLCNILLSYKYTIIMHLYRQTLLQLSNNFKCSTLILNGPFLLRHCLICNLDQNFREVFTVNKIVNRTKKYLSIRSD